MMIKNMPFSFYLIIAFIVLTSNRGIGQTTMIPDPVFEQKLIALGIDSDGLINGQILNSDAAAASSLTFNKDSIHTLKGIEAFVNLDTLGVVDMPFLDSLMITNIASLKWVVCIDNDSLLYVDCSNNFGLNYFLSMENNALRSIDLSNNVGLVSIESINNDSLSNLNVFNNSGLMHLNCSRNRLTSLDVTGSPGLTELICDHNYVLGNIDVSNNSMLTVLNVAHNGITTIDISNNTALEMLNCSENPIYTIDVSNHIGLEYLALAFCELANLDVSTNVNLLELSCEINSLKSLDVSNNLLLEKLTCRDNQLLNLDVRNNLALDYLSCSDNQLSRLALADTTILSINCERNARYLRICVPDSVAAATLDIYTGSGNWTKDPWAIYTENCPSMAVKGRVTIDSNTNCISDSLEMGLASQIVKFEQGSEVFYSTTVDAIGDYTAYLDTGTYTATVIPSTSYWQICPTTQQVYVDTNYTVQTIDWSLQALISCPLLNVDLTAPLLRMTGGGSAYTVSYCNNGTVAAMNAYVEVNLDPDLNYISSTIPLANQTGTIYTFNLGTIGIGQCGSFDIQVVVDTSATVGQTHCSEAHIYPDSICDPNFWTGADIKVNAQCVNDSVIFTIQNIGNNMQQSLNYYIVEDNIMMRQGNFNLANQGITQVTQAALMGRTYRIWAEQENGYPSVLGNPIATAVVEGCLVDSLGGFNTGFVTMYNNNNSSPFIAVDCQESRGSYDPNDKAASPKGYGPQHYIYDHTTLDYKIRFQNTGNDTAFLVVIRDTLSAYLDPASLVMGASSHSYTWSISNQGILEVRFSNILLVDSTTNEPASHGFFQYKIQQKPNNPLGTIINNTAAIYFDYNPPIFTNTTFHEVNDNFIPIILTIEEIFDEAIEVNVYPNPFTNFATIELKGSEYKALNLKVFDLTGKLVLEKQAAASNQIQLSNHNLVQGLYIYALEGDGKLINTGKIIAQ